MDHLFGQAGLCVLSLDIGDPVSCSAASLIFKVPSVVLSLCGALGFPTGSIKGKSKSLGLSASTRAHVEVRSV